MGPFFLFVRPYIHTDVTQIPTPLFNNMYDYERTYAFSQQDSGTFDIANTKPSLQSDFDDRISRGLWAPRSSYLNLYNFLLVGHVTERSNCNNLCTADDLKKKKKRTLRTQCLKFHQQNFE